MLVSIISCPAHLFPPEGIFLTHVPEMHIFLLNGCTKRSSETIDASFFSLSNLKTSAEHLHQHWWIEWCSETKHYVDAVEWYSSLASWYSRVFRLKNPYDWIRSTDTVQLATPSWCCFNPFSPYLQRVVKADIVNYSQDTMARTVNPPRSSMCVLQWTPPPHMPAHSTM